MSQAFPWGKAIGSTAAIVGFGWVIMRGESDHLFVAGHADMVSALLPSVTTPTEKQFYDVGITS